MALDPDARQQIQAVIDRWKQYVAEDDNDDFGLERKSVRSDDIAELEALLTQPERSEHWTPEWMNLTIPASSLASLRDEMRKIADESQRHAHDRSGVSMFNGGAAVAYRAAADKLDTLLAHKGES